MTIRGVSRALAALLQTSIAGDASTAEVQTAEVLAELPETVGNITFWPNMARPRIRMT